MSFDDDRPVRLVRMGQVLRDARPKSAQPERYGPYVNLYAATGASGARLVPFDAGINTIAESRAVDGRRRPAILVASSPHKIGMTENPWQDIFDTDNGYARYYGDNRTPGADPAAKPGNKALLAAHLLQSHHDAEQRAKAPPLLLFRRVRREGQAKGYARFERVAIISGVELVTQYSVRAGGTFANFAFELLVIDLAAESELLDMSWIADRRDPSMTVADTATKAPRAWRDWVAHGAVAVDRVRRRVSKLLVENKAAQMPAPTSREAAILDAVYAFYAGRNARFEALAQLIAERVIAPAGSGDYIPGGLTRATADGGIDFIARLDIGQGFGRAKLVVLGQAKCERPGSPTHGNHIARTVARLRRGWLGVYVTTSYFSAATQREVIEDRYPIVLVCGRRLAEELAALLAERGLTDVRPLLEEVDAGYRTALAPRDPEELLYR